MSDKNQRLFVMIGIPASGKSTLSKEIIDSLEDNAVHVSRDKVRDEIGGVYSVEREKLVYKTYINKIATALRSGCDVVADATNLTPEKRDIYFAICEALEKVYDINITVVGVSLDTQLSTCLERNSKRHELYRIPKCVINEMHEKIIKPSYSEGFKIIFNKN